MKKIIEALSHAIYSCKYNSDMEHCSMCDWFKKDQCLLNQGMRRAEEIKQALDDKNVSEINLK